MLCTAIDVENSNRLVRDAIFWVMGRIGPHYDAKCRVEVVAAGPDSDLVTVVLQPTNFSQNDLLWRRELLAGSYVQPLGTRGSNRVDCRVIGQPAARGPLGELPGGTNPSHRPSR